MVTRHVKNTAWRSLVITDQQEVSLGQCGGTDSQGQGAAGYASYSSDVADDGVVVLQDNQTSRYGGNISTCLELTEPLNRCLSGPEAESLLRKDARLVRELGISGGPVLLWENRYGPFGWHEVDWNTVLGQKKEK